MNPEAEKGRWAWAVPLLVAGFSIEAQQLYLGNSHARREAISFLTRWLAGIRSRLGRVATCARYLVFGG